VGGGAIPQNSLSGSTIDTFIPYDSICFIQNYPELKIKKIMDSGVQCVVHDPGFLHPCFTNETPAENITRSQSFVT
jgi:hypothetical protein